MDDDRENIYKKYRKDAGFSQEEAAYELGTSLTSLKVYEAYDYEKGSGRLPPDNVVVRMAKLYGAEHLMEQHQNENTEIGRERNLKIGLMDLREALLRLQVEWQDVKELEPKIRQVVIDNRISESELSDTKQIIKELTEFVEVASSFRYSLLAQNARCGMKEMIMNESIKINHSNVMIWKKQKTPVGVGAL